MKSIFLIFLMVASSYQIDVPYKHIFYKENKPVIAVTFGVNLHAKSINKCGDGCFDYGNAKLIIEEKRLDEFHIKWEFNSSEGLSVADCFNFLDQQWFGGPEQKNQYWPIQKLVLKKVPYVTKQFNSENIVEPYWLSNAGVYIYTDEKTPLFVDQNNRRPNEVCFIAEVSEPYAPRTTLLQEYYLVIADNAKQAHMHAVDRFLGKPSGIPDEKMFRYPIWSTWAKYKKNIDEKVVTEFANEILKYNFTHSQLEIDDDWEICYGALEFRKSKFPNPKGLIDNLKKKGFRVTLWAHPFINNDCKDILEEAKSKKYLITAQDGVTTETTWWNSGVNESVMIDFTNVKATEWFIGRLKKLQKDVGFDSFKFDAGETSHAPQIPKLNAPISLQPNILTTKYVEACAEFGNMIEVRVGKRTQSLPIFVRMNDKDSRWGYDNGLKSLITTMFVMNFNGYPFVLPDIVAGNAYGNDTVDKELFIRWLQVNTFMPSIQFSIAPWDFNDTETIEISRKFTDLHAKYADKIIELARKSVQDGSPLNPPIWWLDPEDTIALKIDDEFLLGEYLLSAPITEPGQTKRDIYLPAGTWWDANNQQNVTGKRWLKDYNAPLDVLPYFILLEK